MNTRRTDIPGIIVIEPPSFSDARGSFMETWSRARYAAEGVPEDFVQDNVAQSVKGTLRGLHFQHPGGQGKLVSVLVGEVFDVAVDIRRSSPTFGRSFSITLSETNRLQVYLPPGFAHGYLVLSDDAVFHYKCTQYYQPGTDRTVLWNDPGLDIRWPLTGAPLLSPKDAAAAPLSALESDYLPHA